ncbi:hypothetical protein ACFVWG_11810 [Kribbella sp. NPDC058245]|uniref:hypothetical protein n=1 Tax=Kribbella sp. NPDC058245 TaxID=3346399 RepID=UPI0036F0EFFB
MRPRKLTLIAGAFVLAVLSVAPGTAVAWQPPAAVAANPPPDPTDQALVAEPSTNPVTLQRGGVSVTASKTGNLTRQMISVSWTGLDPSSDFTKNAVAIMQCRGLNPTREDCWIGNVSADGDALGSIGMVAKSNFYAPVEPSDWYSTPKTVPSGPSFWVPFRTVDSKDDSLDQYHGRRNANGTWTTFGMAIPEDTALGVKAIEDFTPSTRNFRRGVTQPNGTGQVQTWVNTAAENPSLGCSDKSPCSLVVVPVRDRPCRTKEQGATPLLISNCAKATGATAFGNWQLLANWYERYVFKLSYSPSLPKCVGRTDQAKFIGSELTGEAMRRWVPARCQSSSPSALDYTRAWEPDSLRQLGQRDPASASKYAADAAVVSEPASPDDPVSTDRKPGYAPIAVTGFSIGYSIDKTVDGITSPVTDLKLNQRLVAKMLTQSYPGLFRPNKDGFAVNPNTGSNPANIFKDPEFAQLNPQAAGFAGSNAAEGTQLSMPTARSDVFLALTRWVWADPSARAFLQGKADPWGMTVNKTYRGWQLPTDDYNLNDGWLAPTPTSGTSGATFAGLSPQALWAPAINSWANGADIAMIGWPLSQTPSLKDSTNPNSGYVGKRDQVQLFGTRHIFSLSVQSELDKSGVLAADLRNSAGEFVAPTVEAMGYALDGAIPDKNSGVWNLDYAGMDERGYPGTMISYAAVPTANLPSTLATRYAENIRWMSTDGQQWGQEAGQLPDGYLALTQAMRDQAAKVADAVAAQTGTVPIPPKDPVDDPKDPTPNDPPTKAPNQPKTDSPDNNNGGGAKTPTPTPGPTPSGGPSQPVKNANTKPVAATTGESLGWLAWGLPALLAVGLAAGVASPGIRVIAQPGHPVRRGLASGGSYLAGLLRRGRRRG